MESQNTRVCCCGASTWTSVFAWVEIVVGALGIIGSSVLLVNGDKSREEDYIYKPRGRELSERLLIELLVQSAVYFLLGIFLLIGNKREKIGLLWTWLTITGIGALLSVISGFLAGSGAIVLKIIPVFISAFMIYVVRRRIRDIKITSGGMADGA